MKNKNQHTTIIKIEHFGIEHSVKINRNDVTAPGMLYHVCNLVKTLGYNIDEYINLEELGNAEYLAEEKLETLINN